MRRSVAVLGLAVLLTETACVTVAGPRTFRFASNRTVSEARACALLVLRRHGFSVVPDSTRAATAAAAPDTAAAVSDTVAAPDTAAAHPDTAAVAPDTATVVLIRPRELSDEEPRTWARAELRVGTGPDGEAVVTSILGSSRRERGPFEAPSAELEDVGSEITARCTW